MGIVAFGQIQFLSERVIDVSVGKGFQLGEFQKVWGVGGSEMCVCMCIYTQTHMYIVFCYSQHRVETLEWFHFTLTDGKMKLPAVLGLK